MKEAHLKKTLTSLIKRTLTNLKIPSQDLSIKLELSPQEQFGDLSANLAFILSKRLNTTPQKLADLIVVQLNKELKKSHLKDDVNSCSVAGGGFINFFLDNNYFRRNVKRILKEGEGFGNQNLGKRKKVLIEFVSANPTGPLSIAHARQGAVGDSLANILGALGFSVLREYYINDEGRQIELLGRSIEVRFKQLQGESVDLPGDGYQGQYIVDIAKEIIKSAKPRLPDGQTGVKFFQEFGLNYILKIIKQELEDFGVRFNSWYSQKKLMRSKKIEKALRKLKQKGYIYERDGAVWFKSTMLGDDKDRVLIKSDGSYTYITPDIAYHQDKFKRGFRWLINIWGPDHHGYIPRLKAAVKALGKSRQLLNIIIVQLALIKRQGQSLAMSTRQGQYIRLREVLDEVGKSASRFFFLMRRASAHLDFDMELAKKQSLENPVYYIQYAHARICSIVKKTQNTSLKKADLDLLNQPQELKLMKCLAQFPPVLQLCYQQLEPYFLGVYLQKLACNLHSFYEHHRVLTNDKNLTLSRLGLIAAAGIVLRKGLGLLGVDTPERMDKNAQDYKDCTAR